MEKVPSCSNSDYVADWKPERYPTSILPSEQKTQRKRITPMLLQRGGGRGGTTNRDPGNQFLVLWESGNCAES